MSKYYSNLSPTESSFTAAQIKYAYGLDLINIPNNKPLGYGIKIGIISIYHYSNLQYDLNKYCNDNNIHPIQLNIINQAGITTKENFSLRTCLSVQMINTVVPGASVYVIEAKSNLSSDISTAVLTAVNLGVNIISIGYSTTEYKKQLSMENIFLQNQFINNIVFVVSSGDNSTVTYPASSSNVLAVGGSTLMLNDKIPPRRLSETAYSQSGFGFSTITQKPEYQNEVNSTKYRCIPDVSLIAGAGFNVYCSLYNGYYSCSGTSVGCDLMTGIIAICDQLLKNNNKPMLNSIANSQKCIQKILYETIYKNTSLYNSCMYDITAGTDDSYSAGIGYDIVTGLGSIQGNNFCTAIADLSITP